MPPRSHGPTVPAATASADLGTSSNRARSASGVSCATANQSIVRKSMLSSPVTSSWHNAPRRMASASRTAMAGLLEKWPGDDWNKPAPVAR